MAQNKNSNNTDPALRGHSSSGPANPASRLPISIGEAQPTDGRILIDSYRFNIQNLQETVSTQAAQAYADYLNAARATPAKIAAVGVAIPVAAIGIAAAAIAFDTLLVAGTLLAGTTAAGYYAYSKLTNTSQTSAAFIKENLGDQGRIKELSPDTVFEFTARPAAAGSNNPQQLSPLFKNDVYIQTWNEYFALFKKNGWKAPANTVISTQIESDSMSSSSDGTSELKLKPNYTQSEFHANLKGLFSNELARLNIAMPEAQKDKLVAKYVILHELAHYDSHGSPDKLETSFAETKHLTKTLAKHLDPNTLNPTLSKFTTYNQISEELHTANQETYADAMALLILRATSANTLSDSVAEALTRAVASRRDIEMRSYQSLNHYSAPALQRLAGIPAQKLHSLTYPQLSQIALDLTAENNRTILQQNNQAGPHAQTILNELNNFELGCANHLRNYRDKKANAALGCTDNRPVSSVFDKKQGN